MQGVPEAVESVTMGEVTLPRFEDGIINLQELLRQLAEDVTNEIMDAEASELMRRPVDGLRTPYVWLDATYAKCRRDGRVASTAVVTAIGLDEDGYRVVLGKGMVATESHDSWLSFLRQVRSRGVRGVRLVISDAHQGLRRAIERPAWSLPRGWRRLRMGTVSQLLGRVLTPTSGTLSPSKHRCSYRITSK